MADKLNQPVNDLPSDHLAVEASDPLDMHSLDGQVYTVLKSRIERAIANQKEWWQQGKNLSEFISGEQWAADLKELLSPHNGWIRKTINKMKALRTGILSQVAYQNPKVTGLALRRTADAIGKSTVESTLINYSIFEADFQSQQKKAALDAASYGAGALQLCTNPEKGGIPTVKHRRMCDVVVDPDALTLEDAKWAAYRRTVNIFDARKEFDDKNIVSDQQRAIEAGQKMEGLAPAPEDETIEVWEVWCRADAIGFMDAVEQSARNKRKDESRLKGKDAPAFNRYLSEEGNRVFQLTLHHPKLLTDEPWPFILDNDMLPVWLVYLEEDADKLFPASVLQPAMGLQRAINTVFTCITTQAYTQARIKYAGDKQLLQDPKVMQGIRSAEVGTVVGVDGGSVGLTKIDFGQLNIAVIQLLKETDNFFNQITGYNEMFGGMQGARSAAEAVIREDRAQVNSSSMRQAFETGLKRILRGMSQIAKSTLSAKRVADLVGREEMGYVNPQTGAIDEDDTKNTLCVNWPYDDAKPEEIRRENFIELVVNSTRRANPQQEAQDLRGLIQDIIGLVGTYTQQGYRINKIRMARKLNYVFSRVLQAMGVADYKQMEITPEDLEIDDRLMPRGQTEAQMMDKFKQQQGQEKEAEATSNADAAAEAIAQQAGVPLEVAQTMLAGLTPEMVAALVQEIESSGTMQGGPMPMPMPGAVPGMGV